MSAVATRRGRVAVALSCLALLAGTAAWAVSRNTVPVPDQGRHAPAAADAATWQHARVFDHLGASGAPALAATVRVPDGWQAQLSRAGGCVEGQVVCVLWSARDADGSSGVELLPFESDLLVHDGAGNGGARPQGVEDYLRDLASRRHRHAEVVGYAPAPELVADPPFELVPSSHREAGRLTLVYRRDGREMHEMLAAVVGEPERMAGIADGVPLPRFAQAYAAYAPVGRLDIARAEKIVASWRMDATWLRAQARMQEEQHLMVVCRQMSLASQQRCMEGRRRLYSAQPEGGP